MRRISALLIFAFAASFASEVTADEAAIARLVEQQVRQAFPADGIGGVATALRVRGCTLFFNYGHADVAAARPITPDALFNLGSVAKTFDAVLLTLAEMQGEISLDDPVAKYIAELADGADIRRVTFRQLASFTSGFVLPQDHPPWPDKSYTLPDFIATLRAWRLPPGVAPGRQFIYSHAGYVLIHLALERRFGKPFHELLAERILTPLGLTSTSMPLPDHDTRAFPRGRLPLALEQRAVQGYGEDGKPIGAPGDLQGYYHWVGAGQMYSSARDMAAYLAANLGELAGHGALQNAMRAAQRPVFALNPRTDQALAWEAHKHAPRVTDKYGGTNNAAAYIGMAPVHKIGIVLLTNRNGTDVGNAGRAILRALARRQASVSPSRCMR